MKPGTRGLDQDAVAVAGSVDRWGHAVLRQGAARERWQALEALLWRLDERVRPLSPTAPGDLFAPLRGSEITDTARMFLKCLIKTIVCNSVEATDLGQSPRMLEVAMQYLGTREVYFENGSLRLHLRGDHLEVLNFHVDSATGSTIRMLNCWLPMGPVLPGQEIRMVPLSHRIGARGRRLFEALPERVQLGLSTGITDYAPRDVHLWNGNTVHGRVLNRHDGAAIAMVFRYAGQPLNPDWRPIAVTASPAATAATPESEDLTATLLPEAVALMRSRPGFSAIDSVRLLHSDHLVSHPGIGRQLAMCFIYYCERAGLEHATLHDAAPSGRAYWPAYIIEIYLLLGQFYLQLGMVDKAQKFLTETVRRADPAGSLLDKVVQLRDPALVEAMVQVHDALGMTDRAARFARLRAGSSQAS